MKLTNTNQLPLSLAVWLADVKYDHDPDPDVISATTLIKPIRSIVLGRQNKDLESIGDVVSLVPSSMGSAYHDAIERAWLNSDKLKESLEKLGYPANVIDRIQVNPDSNNIDVDSIPVYLEQRRKKKLGDKYTVSGKFDFVIEGQLEDFKSASVWAYIFESNNEQYIKQGSIYRWLFPDIITSDTINIQYIFTDWSASKVVQDPQYPKSRILTKNLPLMSIAETEQYITTRINQINSLMGAAQDKLPICTPKELWQKESVWKYYKDPNKMTRSTKNFNNSHEAHERLYADGNKGIVVEVQGQVSYCRYCNVVEICDQAKELVKSGLLVI